MPQFEEDEIQRSLRRAPRGWDSVGTAPGDLRLEGIEDSGGKREADPVQVSVWIVGICMVGIVIILASRASDILDIIVRALGH